MDREQIGAIIFGIFLLLFTLIVAIVFLGFEIVKG